MKTKTFADKVIEFNKTLSFHQPLPEGFDVLNPFYDKQVMALSEKFYKKFYNDTHQRRFLMGINPGRLGAGATGIPFTDTKRLQEECGITIDIKPTHEVSSVFVYEMIQAYGGVEKFYAEVYIHSLFPLAIIQQKSNGNWVNCNYYDDKELAALLENYMVQQLKQQISFGLKTDTAFVLGKKNASFFEKINQKEKLFEQIIVLPHPRYIQQYKSKEKHEYIQSFITALRN